MKTNKLTDLSPSDLVSMYNYLREELEAYDNCMGVEDKIEALHQEIVATQKEIERRRSELFNN